MRQGAGGSLAGSAESGVRASWQGGSDFGGDKWGLGPLGLDALGQVVLLGGQLTWARLFGREQDGK